MTGFVAFLCVIALACPVIIMEVWVRRHAREYRADRDNPKDTKIRFRQRRKDAFLYAALSIPFVVAPLELLKLWDEQILGVVAAIAVAIVIFWIVYRCPICYTVPMDGDGWILNPTTCQGCGAPLTGD